jgi:hypothetical protein
MAIGPNGFAAKNAAVGKREYGWLNQEDLRKIKAEANAGCKKAG